MLFQVTLIGEKCNIIRDQLPHSRKHTNSPSFFAKEMKESSSCSLNADSHSGATCVLLCVAS